MMKHQYSIICCARWESNYVGEWLSYYKHIGVDHIYIGCNDDDSSRFCAAIQKASIDPSFYTLKYYPEAGKQIEMYIDLLKTAQEETEWVSFFDIDEFLTLGKFNTVQEWIASYDKNVECIYLHWLMFTNDGYRSRPYGSILRNYLYRDKHFHIHTKHICKANILTEEKIRQATFPVHHALAKEIWTDSVIIDVLGNDASDYVDHFKNDTLDTEKQYGAHDVNNLPHIAHYFLKSLEDVYIRVYRCNQYDYIGQEKLMQELLESKNEEIYLEKGEVFDDSMKVFSEKHQIYYDTSTLNRTNITIFAKNKSWEGSLYLNFETNRLVLLEQNIKANFTFHDEILFVYWDDFPLEIFVKENDTYICVDYIKE